MEAIRRLLQTRIMSFGSSFPVWTAAGHAVEQARQEACRQMREYLQLEEFVQDERIKGVIYVVVEDKIRCFEKVDKE